MQEAVKGKQESVKTKDKKTKDERRKTKHMLKHLKGLSLAQEKSSHRSKKLNWKEAHKQRNPTSPEY